VCYNHLNDEFSSKENEMKKSTISTLILITSAVFNVIAIVMFSVQNSIAPAFLCIGSALLCIGVSMGRKNKEDEKSRENTNESEEGEK
jgi:hypothetical protein